MVTVRKPGQCPMNEYCYSTECQCARRLETCQHLDRRKRPLCSLRGRCECVFVGEGEIKNLILSLFPHSLSTLLRAMELTSSKLWTSCKLGYSTHKNGTELRTEHFYYVYIYMYMCVCQCLGCCMSQSQSSPMSVDISFSHSLQLPRTFVNLVQILDATKIAPLSGLICDAVHL